MSLYENLDTFSALIAALSPKLADAFAMLPNDGAPSYHKEAGEALLFEPKSLLTALATGASHLNASLKPDENRCLWHDSSRFLGRPHAKGSR